MVITRAKIGKCAKKGDEIQKGEGKEEKKTTKEIEEKMENKIVGMEKSAQKLQSNQMQNQASQGHEEFGAQMDRLGARQFAPIAFRLSSQ
jgi:hypothetical protein